MNCIKLFFSVLALVWYATPLAAQDLDPRAYSRVPVNLNFVITGFTFSDGEVVTDPTLPVQNIKASIFTPSVGFAHTFSMFKLTSQALVAVPYSWAKVSGEVGGQAKSVELNGFNDMRLRLSVLLLGAPAATQAELMKAARKTILGMSLNMVVPAGKYNSAKLINLGTNRFSFKPEVALSHPFLEHMLLDVYAGVWLFTDNNSFYPGSSVRSQEPMWTFQGHLSYNIRPQMWVAFDATFYTGGATAIDDIYNDDRQESSRIGATAVLPVGKRSAFKFSYSTGAIVRIGQKFDSYSIGWQTSWIRKSTKEKATNSN
jgi:hypothetical protein